MTRIRPADPKLVEKLMILGKPYFTAAELGRILGLKKSSASPTLKRLTNSGVLTRLKKNVYLPFLGSIDVERIANEIYYPCYLSFEKALSDYGILSQIPYTLTFATPRPSKKIILGNTEVEYSHIQNRLFFGYETRSERNIALPEKALLDQLYLISKGLRGTSIKELDLGSINEERLKEFAQKYPVTIRDLLSQIKKQLTKTKSNADFLKTLNQG